MELTGIKSYYCPLNINSSPLSEETRKKLRELGIDPSTVASEAQAQALIAAVKAKLEVQVVSTQNSCSAELELITRAKSLARKIGVSLPTSSGLKEILKTLEKAINDRKEYQQEYTALHEDYEKLEYNQNSVFTALNQTANLNKFLLGLK